MPACVFVSLRTRVISSATGGVIILLLVLLLLLLILLFVLNVERIGILVSGVETDVDEEICGGVNGGTNIFCGGKVVNAGDGELLMYGELLI